MSAGRTVNSQSHSWGTPLKYIKAIKRFFGGSIALDPCSNEHSIVNAQTEFMLPQHDGLKEDWNYPTIYMNPPYGADRDRGTTIKNWLTKCAVTHKQHGSEILALVPVATNTTHWKQSIFTQAAAICFLYDTRLKFLENDIRGGNRGVNRGGKGAPMACAMIYWGINYDKFYDIFKDYGAVVNITNLMGTEPGSTKIKTKTQLQFS